MTTATDFIAGPVGIDGHQLYFYVELKKPQSALQVLAAAYTAVFMREKADELTFSAYEAPRSRLTEDDWYNVAQGHFDRHMIALQADPAVLRDVREVVERHYFQRGVPAEVYPLLHRAAVEAFHGVAHAA